MRRHVNAAAAAATQSLLPSKLSSSPSSLITNTRRTSTISFLHVVSFLFLYLALGTLSFFLVRHHITGTKTNGFVDALYLCVVTMTTVGYGDLVPNTILAKLLSCLFVFSGMALIGFFLSKAADHILEKQEILMVKALHVGQNVSQDLILRDLQTNKVMHKCVFAFSLLLLLVPVGMIVLTQVEGMTLVDAFYCVCVTITTLGYGDRSFSTEAGRIFAVFWILSGTIFLAQFLLYLAELYTQSRQRSVVQWVLTKTVTHSDLEAADLDHDKAVSAAEFILFKLKEMEKINEEDITPLMEIFDKLAHHSRSLKPSDFP